jgi:hypothetical protein
MYLRKRVLLFLFFFFWIASPRVNLAQSVATGSISGKLTDDQGSAVAGAAVTAVEGAAAQASNVNTDSDGAYVLTLAPGNYTLRFTAGGFKTGEMQRIAVHSGDVLNVSVTLVRGSQAEVVAVTWQATVSGSTPAAPGTAAATGAEAITVKAIPLASRNYTQAAGLASGVSSQVSNATAIGINTQGVQVGSGNTNN